MAQAIAQELLSPSEYIPRVVGRYSPLHIDHGKGIYVWDVNGERYADFTNTYEVDDYALLSLRAGFEATGWRAFVELENALDKAYISTFSVRDTAAPDATILSPGAPLSAYAGVEFRF